uniref:DDE Tnp4 domain-containing protein n=1 Tax=Brassica oleracea var. oleracea TaxID=109376 RepID=A0A0D3CJF5_BRAOL
MDDEDSKMILFTRRSRIALMDHKREQRSASDQPRSLKVWAQARETSERGGTCNSRHISASIVALTKTLAGSTLLYLKQKAFLAFYICHRSQGHLQLWNDYFSEDATYPSQMFRHRFRMNKPLFMHIVDRLSAEIPYFQQRRDATLEGRAPKVNYIVNGHEYHLAYYLTDGIYPKWATFVQSIPLPQGPKTSLFVIHQEAVRKDVERAFGVLQARFATVKNPALLWDKIKIGKIMRACIILHNMIVEDERDGYTQFDVSVFAQPDSSRSS